MTMTIAECARSGGHRPLDGARGVIGGFAEHEQRCRRCPATRRGMLPLHRPDVEMAWTEWDSPEWTEQATLRIVQADIHDILGRP